MEVPTNNRTPGYVHDYAQLVLASFAFTGYDVDSVCSQALTNDKRMSKSRLKAAAAPNTCALRNASELRARSQVCTSLDALYTSLLCG